MNLRWALWLFLLPAVAGGCAKAPPPDARLTPDELAKSPPGFYPGRASTIVQKDRPAFDKFLVDNQQTVALVQGHMKQIAVDPLLGGCMDHDRWTCIATLAQTQVVATDWSPDPADQNLSEHGLVRKLNGDGLAADPLERTVVYRPGSTSRLDVLLTNSPGGGIFNAVIDLPGDPTATQSLADFQKSQAYATIKSFMGPSCDLGVEADFYQTVHDSWKSSSSGDEGVHTQSLDGQACGQDISLEASGKVVNGVSQPSDFFFVSISEIP